MNGDVNKLDTQQAVTNQPCALILIAVSLGIVIDRFVEVSLTFSWAISILLAGFALIARRHLQNCPKTTSFLLLFTSMAWGASWHHWHYRRTIPDDLGHFANDQTKPVKIRGWIAERPQRYPALPGTSLDPIPTSPKTKFRFRVTHRLDGSEWKRAGGKVVVTVGGQLTFLFVGDELLISGQLARPPSDRCAGDFNLREHYRSQRIYAVIFVHQPSNLQRTGNIHAACWFGRALHHLAERCGRTIDQIFSSQVAALVRAMLLGERNLVSPRQQHYFLYSGTMHLFAISGLHVAILSSGWLILIRLGILPRHLGHTLILGLVLIYCFVVGARPPVFRATILIAIYCLGKMSGRDSSAVNSLCLAGIIVLITYPVSLFQVGPQLSFVAVATLIMISRSNRQFGQTDDPLSRFILRKRTGWKRRRDRLINQIHILFCSSFGIWLATLPLVAEYFHVISPIGILVNVLIMLPLALLLNLCFLVVLLGGGTIALPVAALAEKLAQGVQLATEYASRIPGGHWWTSGIGPFWLLVFYLLFGFFFFATRIQVALRWQLWMALIWLTLGFCTNDCFRTTGNRFQATFIDVGHGTSVLMEFPNGKAVLYDAGCLGSSSIAVQRISSVLWSKSVATLDTVFISHADLDHFNAIPGLLERFRIKRVVITSQMSSLKSGPAMNSLRHSLNQHGVPVIAVNADWLVEIDPQCVTQILHPSPSFEGNTDNANSLVMCIRHQGTSLLIPGDLEHEGLEELIKRQAIETDILMVPHHGSLNCEHEKMANWANPNQVVVSCSPTKWNPLVGSYYGKKNSEIYVTGLTGTITFVFQQGRVISKTHLAQQSNR